MIIELNFNETMEIFGGYCQCYTPGDYAAVGEGKPDITEHIECEKECCVDQPGGWGKWYGFIHNGIEHVCGYPSLSLFLNMETPKFIRHYVSMELTGDN